jgi:hypothetical protein
MAVPNAGPIDLHGGVSWRHAPSSALWYTAATEVTVQRLWRTLLIVGGTLCVALGAIGIFVPVLPTTPFLLLAAICYARSSPRFYRWLIGNRWCGAYIRNYREGRGIAFKHKVITLTLLWLSIGYAAIFAVSAWWLRLLLLGIAVGVTLHLTRLRTYRPQTQGTGAPESIEDGRRCPSDKTALRP